MSQSSILGIASGDTTQTSSVLWAQSSLLGTVVFEYSQEPDFSNIIARQTKEVTDINLPVKLEITGLQPGTEYYYRATNRKNHSLSGEFTTATELGVNTGLRFGVSGDWRGELTPYPSIANAVDRNLDFFVQHGDTIYADFPSDAVITPNGDRKEQAETLEEFRAKHAEVYGERFGLNVWGELRASTSILATIDDHEVINDFSGGALALSDSRFPEKFVLINDTQLYENGLQAFQEYNPLQDKFYGETGESLTEGERKLYRFNTYGSDAAVAVVDTRSFRDRPLRALRPQTFIANSLTRERTLLGKVQVEELKQDLLSAEEQGITWKFVMIPEPIQNLGPILASDRYEGYANERSEILSFINENEINNVVFVAADIHGTIVNNLTYQEEPKGEQIPTGAWEISTGSVAFDAPLGQTTTDFLTNIAPNLKNFYDTLPIAPDMNNVINDKDDFVQNILDIQLNFFGYDPVGLNNNLDAADNLIDATLLQGDYLATHTFGWTEFDIESQTQELTVTTYGIEPYSEEELLANPEAIIAREPTIVSQFVVNPINEI